MPRFVLPSLILPILLGAASFAADASKAETVEQIAAAVHPSIAVLTVNARDGKGASLGTGFVVSADGLIATNFHVIDVGRAVTVELADGKQYPATEVYAADRERDLAVIRIGAKGLTPLKLGDSTKMKDGQAVVAVGNPRGFEAQRRDRRIVEPPRGRRPAALAARHARRTRQQRRTRSRHGRPSRRRRQ